MIRFREEDIRWLALELPDSVKFYKYAGDFAGETEVIRKLLASDGLFDGLRRRLQIELVIAEGMSRDYLISFDGLLSRLREKYPLLDAGTLREIVAGGGADYIMRSGEPFFQNSCPRNLLNRCRDRLESPGGAPAAPAREWKNENIRIMMQKGFRRARVRVREQLSFAGDPGPGAGNARVHLPYPCECPEQTGILLHGSSHPVYISDAPQRTAFIETPYVPGDRYWIEFSYTITVPYREPDPAEVSADQPAFCTGELYPHIRFTPAVRALADELSSDGANNLVLARRAYDWITSNVVYSYMRSYLYIDNITEFCLLNRRGDCGVQALLFITLCRAMGVPARWQSGSRVEPGEIGSHDWAQYYVEPYGWLYCDPSYGGSALRAGNTERWNYYAGNLDIFREINATEFQSPFDPPRFFMRHDPYDNQCGEGELDNAGPGEGEVKTSRSVVAFEADV